MSRIYIGESVTLRVDFAASLTDPDYDLSAAELICRIARPGSTVALFEVDASVVDDDAGTADIVFDSTATGLLTEGTWTAHVSDTVTGLTLYDFEVTAVQRIGAVGDIPDRSVLRLPYSAYLAAGGGSVPESAWERYSAQAARAVQDATMQRAVTSFDDHEDAITEALLRATEVLYAADTGIVSESLAGYSYTLGDVPTRADAKVVIIMALALTGLTYTGL